MKALAVLLCLAPALLGARQAPAPKLAPGLAQVYAGLDATAPTLHALSADADLTDFTALVNNSDHSSGKFYFERSSHGPMYRLDITQPTAAAKSLLFRDQTGWLFTLASQTVDQYPLGSHQSQVNEYFALGVGTTSAALQHSFHVSFDGAAPLAGAPAVKLTLTPILAAGATAPFDHIDVWYDPATWITAQLQIFYPGGDYHLVTYHHVAVNPTPPLDEKLFAPVFPHATVVPH